MDFTEASIQRIVDSTKGYEPFDSIEADILIDSLKEEGLSFDILFSKINSVVENDFFIGCYTDNTDPEYMWQEYAQDDGICIELETTGLRIYKVLYKDYLEQYRVLIDQYRKLMVEISLKQFEDLKSQLKEMIEKIMVLTFLCFYRKNETGNYPKEGEWREIIPRTENLVIKKTPDGKWDYALVSPPGKFVKINSRMSDEDNEMLRKQCDKTTKLVCEQRPTKTN